MGLLKEFREFAVKGNAIDLAVGVIVGGVFGAIVNSLVSDVVMPPIGMLLRGVDFANLFFVLQEGATPGPYATLDAAQKAGAVTINIGLFVNALIKFVITAFAVFMLVKSINKLRAVAGEEKKAEEAAVAEDVKLLTEIRDLLKQTQS